MSASIDRARWAAIGAVLAICLGAGGFGIAEAVKSSGERGSYTPVTACRLLDTRPHRGIGGRTTPLGPGETHTVTATGASGQCTGTPSDITAVELNVTTVDATGNTHLTIWPSGPVPNASSLNPAPGQPPTPNAVTTKVHTNGSFRIFNFQATVHVIVDLVGYYQDHNHDDRYLRSGVTDSISLPGGAFTTRQGQLQWQTGTACFRPDPAANGMRHAIPVPAGSTITSIGVRATSPQYPSQYAMTLIAQRPGSSTGPTVWSQNFPTTANVLHEQTVDIPDEVADPGEALYLVFTPADSVVHLCAATVHFTRPAT
jgi:hypothetical protein